MVKIAMLSENTSLSPMITKEHGLSLHIEMKHASLLFDMGGSEVFKENAIKMGIDLATVDLAILSHGHRDHGGGLQYFLQNNNKAPVYMSPYAFADYRSHRTNGEMAGIGLDNSLVNHERFLHVTGQRIIK